MKKIIAILCLALVLSSCSATIYTPVLNTEFTENAVYKTGDFSYSCSIDRNGGGVAVRVLSTNAQGLVISFDGSNVTYEYRNMKKSFPKDKIDKTNPAIVIYEVFFAIDSENINSSLENDCFKYCGKTSIGDFVLIQNMDNSISSIKIDKADIEILFNNKK